MLEKESVRKKDVLWAIFLLLLSAIYLWQMRPCSICLEGACEEICLIDKQTGCVYKIVVTDPPLQPSRNMPEPERFSFLHFGEIIGHRDTVKNPFAYIFRRKPGHSSGSTFVMPAVDSWRIHSSDMPLLTCMIPPRQGCIL